MRTVLRFVLIGAVGQAAVSIATAQETWVGKTIIIKKVSGIKITRKGDDGQQIDVGELKDLDYRVLGDQAGRLQVNDGSGNIGWFDKAEAVLLEDAVRYFSDRIKANPKDGPCYHHRGVVWRLKGELDLAIRDFGEALQFIDSDPAVYINRGNAWHEKRDFDKAIMDYNDALRLDPKSAATFNNRGNVWSDKKDIDKAIADYNEAIRLNPKYVSAHCNRGHAWLDKKNYDKAIADYSEAIQLHPTYADAYVGRAIAWHEKKDYDNAIKDYSEVIRIDPKDTYSYLARASVWRAKNRFDKAIADYDEAIRLNPKFASAFNSRAWLLATCPDAKYRDGKKAVESAKRALGIDPKVADFMDTLAAAYAESGDFVEAVRWQEKALEDPTLKKDHNARRRLELYKKEQPFRQE